MLVKPSHIPLTDPLAQQLSPFTLAELFPSPADSYLSVGMSSPRSDLDKIHHASPTHVPLSLTKLPLLSYRKSIGVIKMTLHPGNLTVVNCTMIEPAT